MVVIRRNAMNGGTIETILEQVQLLMVQEQLEIPTRGYTLKITMT